MKLHARVTIEVDIPQEKENEIIDKLKAKDAEYLIDLFQTFGTIKFGFDSYIPGEWVEYDTNGRVECGDITLATEAF